MPSDEFHDSYTFADASLDDNHNNERRQQSTLTMSKPSPKILSLILRAIIMSLLTSVFFLFVGIAAIFLTHLFLAGRHLHRHQRRRQAHFPMSNGMSNADLHQLPEFRFDGGSEVDCGSECVICLDRIRDGDLFRILPGCSHVFHLDCIDRWLLRAPACPVCRGRVCAGAEMMSVSSFGLLGLEANQPC